MVDGKKHVESIPAEWIDAVRPAVEAGRGFKDSVAELFSSTLNYWCSHANSGADMLRPPRRRSERR